MRHPFEMIVEITIFFVLLVGGFIFGRLVELAHLRRLAIEEEELSDIMVTDLRRLPANWNASHAVLVTGTCVIATDYFKVFIAGLRNLFGGNVPGYEVLMNRARRQARVRMLQEARRLGANVVWNVRIETSSISETRLGRGVEAIIYGTAMRVT